MTDTAGIVERLRLAEAWFACTSGDPGKMGATIPVVRGYGIEIFKTAADLIQSLTERVEEWKGLYSALQKVRDEEFEQYEDALAREQMLTEDLASAKRCWETARARIEELERKLQEVNALHLAGYEIVESARIQRLTAALEWYADPKNWERDAVLGEFDSSLAMNDFGNRARATLKAET